MYWWESSLEHTPDAHPGGGRKPTTQFVEQKTGAESTEKEADAPKDCERGIQVAVSRKVPSMRIIRIRLHTFSLSASLC